METARQVHKVLVHLSRDNAAPQCARFVQSVTGHFSSQAEARVGCYLDNNRFVLCGGAGKLVPLKRPAFCPFKHLSVTQAAAIPLEVQNRGVDVGVAVLLQSANQRVLLTRRAAGLRIFPGVWVPPGCRELNEETGLKLELDDICPQILGLWESVYPPRLSRGSPVRHHIVTYMLLHSPHTHTQLQVGLRPDPAEVSGCVWVDRDLARAIVSSVEGEEGEVCLQQLPPTVSVTEVSTDGGLRDSVLPVSVLCNSTGTKFALELWLNTL
ncbi:Nucleoside diphosphate-linked moiety X motif 17 [Merluccius polli]|uniref:m7GpppN-mRNA hydrolase NUDT17 n=1 Tax=Merluccius polli TaxID=89951 RepID=A0AA47LZ15_MERPO|nr:Nucleoside diphosphate-linked moiety X motif 17 [Merluccius polli]